MFISGTESVVREITQPAVKQDIMKLVFSIFVSIS